MKLNNIGMGFLCALLVGDIAVHLIGLSRPAGADAVPGVIRAHRIELIDQAGKRKGVWFVDNTDKPLLSLGDSEAAFTAIEGGRIEISTTMHNSGIGVEDSRAGQGVSIAPECVTVAQGHNKSALFPDRVFVVNSSHHYQMLPDKGIVGGNNGPDSGWH